MENHDLPIVGAFVVLAALILTGIICIICNRLNTYDAVVVYNASMTEVLYSNADGCSIEAVDGKLVVITGKDE